MPTTAPVVPGAFSLINDPPASGAENMARDIALLEACARGEIAGAVRLYGFAPPCLSIGRTQAMSDIDVVACARDGIDVVRRPSGGRAVLHDQEVTYAVVCRVDDPDFGGGVLNSCSRIHQAVAAGLLTLGIATSARAAPRDIRADARALATSADCFARPAVHELLDSNGRKLVGSAQARRGSALLQHGSVLLDPPGIGTYLRQPSAIAGGSGARALLGRRMMAPELRSALREGFAGVLASRLLAAT